MTAMTSLGAAEELRAPGPVRVLWAEVADELRAILREPAALFFSVIMPVMFYALFAALFRDFQTDQGLPAATAMLATYGTFGVGSVVLLNPGIGVAEDRARGWLRVKKVSATPVSVTLLAKVLATLPYALAVIIALTLISLVLQGPVLEPVRWLRLVAVLLIGALPLAFIGLTVGFLASATAATAVLNGIWLPMVVASGLWMPLSIMPSWVQSIASFLPPYHLAQLALAQISPGSIAVHLLALLVTGSIGGVLAGVTYRNLRL